MKNNNLIAVSGKIGSGKDTVGSIILYLIATKDRKLSDYPYTYQEYLERRLGNEIAGWKIKKFADKLKSMVCLMLGCTRAQLEDRKFKEQELGEEWWYYKYYLHTTNSSIVTGETILDKEGKPGRVPVINEKTGLQEWKFIAKDFIDKYMSLEEQKYHNVTLVKLTPRLLLQLLGTECGRDIIHPNIWVNALFADYKALKPVKTIEPLKRFELGENIEYPKWIITDLRFPNELKAVEQKGGITIRVNREIKHQVEALGGRTNVPEGYFPTNQHPSETALDNTEFDYTIDNNGTIEDLIEKVKNILIAEKLIENIK